MLAEIHETLRQVKSVLTDAAHLNRQMPKFLENLAAAFTGTKKAIRALESKVDKLAR